MRFLAPVICLGLFMSCLNAATNVTLDPDTKFQTITGWEVTLGLGTDIVNENPTPGSGTAFYPGYEKLVTKSVDKMVNELGINAVRLELWRGMVEVPPGTTKKYFNGEITFIDGLVLQHWNYNTNDNNDPDVINWDNMDFEYLDSLINIWILPLRKEMEKKGEKLHITMTNIGHGHGGNPEEGKIYRGSSGPQEIAEVYWACFEYMKNKYGFFPDAIEVYNEPDNFRNRVDFGPVLGKIAIAVGKKLKEKGFTPKIGAPSTSVARDAVPWLDEMEKAGSDLYQYLTDLNYHTYEVQHGEPRNNANNLRQQIAAKAKKEGLRTNQTEYKLGDAENLFDDLIHGNVSLWQRFGEIKLTNDINGNDNEVYYLMNNSNINNPQIALGRTSYGLRQVFHYVRAGAKRIKATSSGSDVVAFINEGNKYVVCVRTNGAEDITVNGLPKGTYKINYSTNNSFDEKLSDVVVGNDGKLSVRMPAEGVLTIYDSTTNTVLLFPENRMGMGKNDWAPRLLNDRGMQIGFQNLLPREGNKVLLSDGMGRFRILEEY